MRMRMRTLTVVQPSARLSDWRQMMLVRLPTELEQARRRASAKAVELRDAPPPPHSAALGLGPAAERAGGGHRVGHGAHGLALAPPSFGVSFGAPSLAMAKPEFPGVFASLSAALFSLTDTK